MAKTTNPFIETALAKLAQDENLLITVIDTIVVQWPAEEAVLKKALAEKDFDRMRKSFHTLSGSVAYFSFELSKTFHDLSDDAAAKKPLSAQHLNVVLHNLDELIEALQAWQRSRKKVPGFIS